MVLLDNAFRISSLFFLYCCYLSYCCVLGAAIVTVILRGQTIGNYELYLTFSSFLGLQHILSNGKTALITCEKGKMYILCKILHNNKAKTTVVT